MMFPFQGAPGGAAVPGASQGACRSEPDARTAKHDRLAVEEVPTMRCSACESTHISEPFPYASYETHLRVPGGAKGLLGPKDLTVGPSFARVCGGCGHVMLFLSREDLEQVRRAVR